jgi:hypothetical protein
MDKEEPEVWDQSKILGRRLSPGEKWATTRSLHTAVDSMCKVGQTSLSSLGRGGPDGGGRESFLHSYPLPQLPAAPPHLFGGRWVKSPLMCRTPPTLLNPLTGCGWGGIWPRCRSNCTGSSQTLSNPLVTLPDLSPLQPMDNRNVHSRGPRTPFSTARQGSACPSCRLSSRLQRQDLPRPSTSQNLMNTSHSPH